MKKKDSLFIIQLVILISFVCGFFVNDVPKIRISNRHRNIYAINAVTDAISREDFPILATDAYPGKKLIFLDSAASSQKPFQVLEAMDSYYKTSHANVHRGAHALAVKATEKYEKSREIIKNFINARSHEEIVFTRGATEAINLVALSWSQRLKSGGKIRDECSSQW